MPLALILIAVGLILAGVRGSYAQLGTLLKGDFTGQGNFLNWLVAFGIVGCIGYVPKLERWSRLFMVLIMLAMFLEQDTGLFAKFVAALQGATAGTPNYSPGNPNAQQSSGGGGILGSILGAIGAPAGVQSAIAGIGSNPLGSLPGAPTSPLVSSPPTGSTASPLLGASPGSIQANPAGILNGASIVPNPQKDLTGDPGVIPGL